MKHLPPLTFFFLVLAGCSSDHDAGKTNVAPGDPYSPYDNANVNVIGTDSSGGSSSGLDDSGMPAPNGPTTGDVLVASPQGPGGAREICISDTLCEVPNLDDSGFCDREGGPIDLIYVDGVLVETICYPPAVDADRPTEVVTSTTGDIDVVQNANKTTVVFDESTNGVPLVGDITVDGNKVAIYGNGPDNTIIDGSVTLDGNNARLRGVTITGDLIVSKNNIALVLTRVLGSIRLSGQSTNNSVIAENDIFGALTSDSNNNLIVGNEVLGEWSHTGNGNLCDRNLRFTDNDGDQLVDDGEQLEALDCD